MDESGELLLEATGYWLPDSVTAYSGAMYIRFVSDHFGTGAGWEARWRTLVTEGAPVASSSASNLNPLLNVPVQFTGQSTEFPRYWQWDFGDGASSYVKNPVHTYSTPGVYTVQLVVDNCVALDTTSLVLEVQEVPVAGIEPDTLNLTIDCGASRTDSILLSNSGAGGLLFHAEIAGWYDSTSVQAYNSYGASTVHSFFATLIIPTPFAWRSF